MMRQTFLISKTLRIGLCLLGFRKAVDKFGNRIATPRAPSIDLIRILIEGTYTSFPQALKEFISNSYDAYATDVALRFDGDFSILSIRDNGEGMSADDFENVFASIARTGRTTPPSPETNRLARDKIGRFGIGSLAVVGTADRFTVRLVPQINGTYDQEWSEGTAMVLRRLMETLIIEIYMGRGWSQDVQDPGTNEFLQFKSLIDKLNGDARFRMQRRTIEGRNKVKEVGDTAAHDFRIRIRKSDLDRIQSAARLTCERLIFTIGESAPTG